MNTPEKIHAVSCPFPETGKCFCEEIPEEMYNTPQTTPDTEWKKEFDQFVLDTGRDTAVTFLRVEPDVIKSFIKSLLSSRDTYWKERVEEVLKKAVADGACGSYKDGIRKALSTFTNKDNLK